MKSKSSKEKPRILFSVSPPDTKTNPYIHLLVNAIPSRIEIFFFSTKKALFSKYDILHIHWPEHLYRRKILGSSLASQIFTLLLILKIKISRIQVVQTAHNLHPHESNTWVESILLRLVNKITTHWVRINPLTQTPDLKKTDTILHGHYIDWFKNKQKFTAVPNRLLNFGLIRAYKGVEDLLISFKGISAEDLTLHVVGHASDISTKKTIQSLAELDHRVQSTLHYLSDNELCEEITKSEIIILPYKNMHNSGAALLALSLERPVIAPMNSYTLALQKEVGEEWVFLYDAPLDSIKLNNAIKNLQTQKRKQSPDLSSREWINIGLQHYEMYTKLLNLS